MKDQSTPPKKKKLNKNRFLEETCRKCGKVDTRENMKHRQAGFFAEWRCKDLDACLLRQ